MGLDISAWRDLRRVANDPTQDQIDNSYIVQVKDMSAFPGRAAPFEEGYYQGVRFAHFTPYCTFFPCGAYSGYGAWREWLSDLAGYPLTLGKDVEGKDENGHVHGAWEATAGPFWELINFSDCEGFIGATACEKLTGDFATFEGLAEARAVKREHFMSLYRNWHQAFAWGANGGGVQFH